MQPRRDRTLTRADLADAVVRATGLPRADTAKFVALFLDLICEALLRGEPVLLSGFGKFTIVPRAARRARNVRAGVEVMVAPRLALVFRPAAGLVDQLNAKTSATSGQDEARKSASA